MKELPLPEDTGTEGNGLLYQHQRGNHLILQKLILRSQPCAYFKKMVVVVVIDTGVQEKGRMKRRGKKRKTEGEKERGEVGEDGAEEVVRRD